MGYTVQYNIIYILYNVHRTKQEKQVWSEINSRKYLYLFRSPPIALLNPLPSQERQDGISAIKHHLPYKMGFSRACIT